MAEIRFLCDCGSTLVMQNDDEEKLAGTEVCGKCGRVYAVAATMSVIDWDEHANDSDRSE